MAAGFRSPFFFWVGGITASVPVQPGCECPSWITKQENICGWTDTATLTDSYIESVTNIDNAIRDNSLSDNSVTSETLPKLFTRKGCG